MLLSFVKDLFRRGVGKRDNAARSSATVPVRLHIGGQVAHPDWKILDVRPGPNVDYVGHCADLSEFDDEIGRAHV